MAKDIVMIHGPNEGAWVFDQFKAALKELGWACHAPDLIGHGLGSDKKGTALTGVGMADYLAELEAFLKSTSRFCLATRWEPCSRNNSRQRGSPARSSW